MNALKPIPLSDKVELERMVPVKQAADIRGISEATYERQYGHTIEKVSERRRAVRLKNAINPPPKP
jgi:hypothetical protein